MQNYVTGYKKWLEKTDAESVAELKKLTDAEKQ